MTALASVGFIYGMEGWKERMKGRVGVTTIASCACVSNDICNHCLTPYLFVESLPPPALIVLVSAGYDSVPRTRQLGSSCTRPRPSRSGPSIGEMKKTTYILQFRLMGGIAHCICCVGCHGACLCFISCCGLLLFAVVHQLATMSLFYRFGSSGTSQSDARRPRCC